MSIKLILSWHHLREFTALPYCEHCCAELEAYGYDDPDFHQIVITAMKCAACGKVGDGGDDNPDDPTV
jgi:hypothetical protein